MSRSPLLLQLIATIPLCFSPGCGDSDPVLVPVSGVVRVEGKPQVGVGVSYHPDSAQGNESPFRPSGTTDAEGRYQLETLAEDGAPVGKYVVVVSPPVPSMVNGAVAQAPPREFNAKYSDPSLSGLNIDVQRGNDAGTYDLELSR